MVNPCCYNCGMEFRQGTMMVYQFTDGGETAGEVTLTAICEFCGAENDIFITGRNIWLESANEDESRRTTIALGRGRI